MSMKKFLIATALTIFFIVGIAGQAFTYEDEIVSFNTATVEELMAIELVRIPKELAEAIVEYRETHGRFKSPDELLRVPGMTHFYIEELNPVMMDGDVVFDPDAEPALAPSKC